MAAGAGRTHYQVLGVARNCTTKEAKEAFRRLAKATHPDAGGKGDSAAEFLRVAEAGKVLGDPLLRASYDQELARKAPGGDWQVQYHYHWVNPNPAASTGASEPFVASRYTPRSSDRPSAQFYRSQQHRAPRSAAEMQRRLRARAQPVRSGSTVLSLAVAIPLGIATVVGIGLASI